MTGDNRHDPVSGSSTVRPLDLTIHPGHLARRMQQTSYALWTSMVSEEITAPQFVVLNVVLGHPDIDQRTVGELASLDRSTVTEVVTRLVRRGLMVRLRDPADGRRNVLELTPIGRARLRDVGRRTRVMNKQLLAPLNPAEQALLLELMRRVVEGGEAARS